MGKFLTFILCIVAFVWCGLFGVNMQNAKSLKEPMVLEMIGDTNTYGTTTAYDGLGYDYYVKKEVLEDGSIAIVQTKMTFFGHIIGEAVGENVLDAVSEEDEETVVSAEVSAEEVAIEEVVDAETVETEEVVDENIEEVPEETETPVVVETMMNLYYPDDQLMGMEIRLVQVSMSSPQDLVDAWLSNGGISADIRVQSFSGGTIDMNQEFADFICNYGTSGEMLYLEGFAQTIKDYYGLEEVYITVAGEFLATGHSIYDFPL